VKIKNDHIFKTAKRASAERNGQKYNKGMKIKKITSYSKQKKLSAEKKHY